MTAVAKVTAEKMTVSPEKLDGTGVDGKQRRLLLLLKQTHTHFSEDSPYEMDADGKLINSGGCSDY